MPTPHLVGTIEQIAGGAESRDALWADFVNGTATSEVAEIGVWTGHFAAHLLRSCPSISRYFLIDPWRHLDDWNKPLNVSEREFDEAFDEAMQVTAFAADRRTVLRGTTSEVIDQIPDRSLDFVYVDGDHTLRGITIDLARSHAKVRPGGVIGGDDLSPTIWQHGRRHEPTLVFPYVVYFAEATNATLVALPFNQYLMITASGPDDRFSFVDLTGRYGAVDLRSQLEQGAPTLGSLRRRIPKPVRGLARGLQSAVRTRFGTRTAT